MENNTNSASRDDTDPLVLIQTIMTTIGVLAAIIIPYIIKKHNNYTNIQKKLCEIKTEILSFLKEGKGFTENTIEAIKIVVIEPILCDKALRNAIITNNSNYNVTFDMFNIMSLVIHWARGVLFYRKCEHISVADKILSFIHQNILENWTENSRCSNIFPELSEVYGRILDSQQKPDEAKKLFTQAQAYAANISSFTEVTAQRLLLWLQHKQIAKEIKDLKVKYNSSLETLEFKAEKETIHDLITKCSNLVELYQVLKNDKEDYVLSYLDKVSKSSNVKPSLDTLHQLKCSQKLLYLELYKVILQLLLTEDKNDALKVETAIHKLVLPLLQYEVPLLKYTKHHSLLQNNKTSVNSEDLDNDNTKKNEAYNILLHSEVQDVVYVLQQIQRLLIHNVDKNYVSINSTLENIHSTLENNYNQNSNYFRFMFIDNAKFHCMHARYHGTSNKNITTLKNKYPNCLDLYVSNIFDCSLRDIQNNSVTINIDNNQDQVMQHVSFFCIRNYVLHMIDSIINDSIIRINSLNLNGHDDDLLRVLGDLNQPLES